MIYYKKWVIFYKKSTKTVGFRQWIIYSSANRSILQPSISKTVITPTTHRARCAITSVISKAEAQPLTFRARFTPLTKATFFTLRRIANTTPIGRAKIFATIRLHFTTL